jgi:hypothetical protein
LLFLFLFLFLWEIGASLVVESCCRVLLSSLSKISHKRDTILKKMHEDHQDQCHRPSSSSSSGGCSHVSRTYDYRSLRASKNTIHNNLLHNYNYNHIKTTSNTTLKRRRRTSSHPNDDGDANANGHANAAAYHADSQPTQIYEVQQHHNNHRHNTTTNTTN